MRGGILCIKFQFSIMINYAQLAWGIQKVSIIVDKYLYHTSPERECKKFQLLLINNYATCRSREGAKSFNYY